MDIELIMAEAVRAFANEGRTLSNFLNVRIKSSDYGAKIHNTINRKTTEVVELDEYRRDIKLDEGSLKDLSLGYKSMIAEDIGFRAQHSLMGEIIKAQIESSSSESWTSAFGICGYSVNLDSFVGNIDDSLNKVIAIQDKLLILSPMAFVCLRSAAENKILNTEYELFYNGVKIILTSQLPRDVLGIATEKQAVALVMKGGLRVVDESSEEGHTFGVRINYKIVVSNPDNIILIK